MIAYAQTSVTAPAVTFLGKVKDAILFPLISLLLGVAVVYFLWGVFQMVMNADNAEARITGRSHMLWGVIGIVVMLSALALLKIAATTFGVTVPSY